MRIFELCGTPNDENFPGVTELPHFNRNFPQWKSAGRFDSSLVACVAQLCAGHGDLPRRM